VLNQKQIGKLSNLFMDLGKAMFIGAFTLPILTNGDIITLIKLQVAGIVFVALSLYLDRK
jgi:hypothetical protein